jgi:hypothetical protein
MLYKIAALIALPILLVQGGQARKRALKLSEAIGEREGAMAVDGFHPGPNIYLEWGLSLSKRIIYIAKSLPHESGSNI